MGAKLKELLRQGKLVRVMGLGQLCDPKLIEMVGHTGFWDAVWFDQEHVGLTVPQIEHAARAAKLVSLDSFVRLNATDYAVTMQCLEAGAGGVMAAQVRSQRETQDVVRWGKFHPEGQRGVNGTGADGRYGSLPLLDYFARANADTFIAIQIENVEGLQDVERIAAVPGVDVLFIGPADLSQSLGIPGQWEHPQLWAAFERVAAACQANNIHWAILPFNVEFARRCVALGCRMLSLGIDMWVIQRGLRSFQSDYAAVTL
jgi:2-keto-3-deoxy-L-rhamnonate aldolase RhmA